MGGDNMESLLLGGDDDDDSESDTEQAAVAAATAAPPPPAASAVVAAPAPPPAASAMSQSEMAQRLKSMYSPATKAGGGAPQAAVAQLPPQAVPRPAQHPVIPQVQVQQMHQQPVPQQQQPQQQPSVPPSSTYAASSSTSGSLAIAQQQQQHRGGVPHQQLPPRVSSVPHPQQTQQRPSSGMPPQQQQQVSRTSSVPHPSSSAQQQQPRPVVQQQQAAVQQRPSGGVPHQQPSAHRNSHGQPQQQAMTAPPTRAPAPGVQGTQQQQQQHQLQSVAPRSNYGVSNGAQQQQQLLQPTGSQSGGTQDRAAMERDLKKQKEKFLIFTRVLMKYLEQKDPPLHLKVKAIIKECAERNRKKEPGYESVTASMRLQLKKVVNEGYWKRAEAYLDHFLKEKAKTGSQSALMLAGTGSGLSSTTSSGNNVSSAASHDALQRKQAEQQQMQQQQRKQEASRAVQQEQVQASLSSIRDEMNKKRQTLATTAGSSRNGSAPKTAPTFAANKGKGAAKSRAKGASTPTGQQQRKTSLPSVAAAADAAPAPSVAPVVTAPPVIRDYNELMEHVDHAANFDWTVAGSILGDLTKYTLTDEQRKLVYDSKTTVYTAVAQAPGQDVSAFPLEGWSQRNVISSRVAWSRLRLGRNQLVPAANPVVGGGLLSMPSASDQGKISMEENAENSAALEVDAVWYNEEKAEEDTALAVLSEGVEIYLRSVLEKALHCARQRQNLDGIRLWHQQFAPSASAKPALSIRLGCDVDRQVAQAAGNAAMTCKRMEEALERQSDVPSSDRALNDDTLVRASSMSDLALRPKMGKAVAEAEVEGKRNFDIYGGKESEEPPFGRVPKLAKLEVIDFQTGMSFARPGGHHQASTLSSSFFF